MDTTDGFIQNLFRTEKPPVTRGDFNNPDFWVCDFLNEDPEVANQYILYRLENAIDDDKRLAFLYDCRHCIRYALVDLKEHRDNPIPGWRPSCCGRFNFDSPEESIKAYESALNKVEHAICHYLDCASLVCGEASIIPNEAKERKPQTENTTARQVLAMYYLAEHLGIWGAVDKANMESFTEFLTGKSHSDIHKKFKSPLDNKESPKEKKKDLRFVKAQFEKLGLRDIVAKINADMP